MSEAEMQQAEKSLLDDKTMSDIIQREPFLPMPDENDARAGLAAAYLRRPVGFFDRHRLQIPDDEDVELQDPRKRTLSSRENSKVDSDGISFPESPHPPPKRSRIEFAPTVEVVRDAPESIGCSLSVSPCLSPAPSLSPVPPLGGDHSGQRRVSLFGP